MRRLRILFIPEWYPTDDNSACGAYVKDHAKAVALADDVIVLRLPQMNRQLAGWFGMEKEAPAIGGVDFPTYRPFYRPLPAKLGYMTYIGAGIRAVRSLIRDGWKPDVIHAHVYEAGALALFISKYFGIPLVITEHSVEFLNGAPRGLNRWKARLAFRWADRVIPVTGLLQNAITGSGLRGRFQVVPNPVDLDLFKPRPPFRIGQDQTQQILFVGTLQHTDQKGMQYLLPALASLGRIQQDWHLHVVGGGPARAEFQGMAHDLGLDRQVTFHGVKTRTEIAAQMQRADFFVFPSSYETFGCVLVEAMASGLPAVAMRVGVAEEVVNVDSGMLVPPRDVSALTAALEKMLATSTSYVPEKVAAGVQRFECRAVGNQLHSIYTEVLN